MWLFPSMHIIYVSATLSSSNRYALWHGVISKSDGGDVAEFGWQTNGRCLPVGSLIKHAPECLAILLKCKIYGETRTHMWEQTMAAHRAQILPTMSCVWAVQFFRHSECVDAVICNRMQIIVCNAFALPHAAEPPSYRIVCATDNHSPFLMHQIF